MKTEVINFKVEPALKKKAQKKAAELGFSLSSILSAYLKKFTQVKSIDFLDKEKLELSDWAKKELKKSQTDIQTGRVVNFENPEEEFAYLDNLIADAEKTGNNN